MALREEMLQSLISHAEGHIAKHKMNVEIYLEKSVGIGEHSDILEAVEKELNVIAEYHDQIEVLKTYF